MSYKTNRFDDEVVRILKSGGAGLLPADTIYGLSCSALNKGAVKRLYKIKKREKDKPFIVLISGTSQLAQLGVEKSNIALALKYWPGPLTLICPAAAPDYLRPGTQTLAIRLPDYPQLTELIKKTGPIISTSANLSGGEPTKSAADAQQYFGDSLDFYVDIGPRYGQPSTIVQPVFDKLKVIRHGAVKIKGEDIK